MGYDPIGVDQTGKCDTRVCSVCQGRTFAIKSDGPNMAWLSCMRCGSRQPDRCTCLSCATKRDESPVAKCSRGDHSWDYLPDGRCRCSECGKPATPRARGAVGAKGNKLYGVCACVVREATWDGDRWLCRSCGGVLVPRGAQEARRAPHTDRCMCGACTAKRIEVERVALHDRLMAYERRVRERRMADVADRLIRESIGRMPVARALVSVACAAVVVEGLQLLRRVVLRVIR